MRVSTLTVALVLTFVTACVQHVSSQVDEASWDATYAEFVRERRGSSNLSRRQEVDEESRKAAEITGDRGRASKTTAPSSRKPGQRWSPRATSERPSPSEPLSGSEESLTPRQHKETPAPSQRSRPERGRRKYNTNIVASQNSRNIVASQNNNEAKNESISESHTQRTDVVTPKHTRSTAAQRRTSKSSDELDISEDDNYPEAFKQQILSKKPATVSSTPPSRARNSKNVSTESPDTAETSTPATSTSDGRIESPSGRRTTLAPEITTHKGSVNSRNAILRQASRTRNSPKPTQESVTEITQITSITTGGTSRVRYSAKHRRLHTPTETKDTNDTARPKQRFSAKFNNEVKNEIKSDSAVASTIPNAVTEPSTKVPTRRLRDKFPSSTPRAPPQKTKDVTNIPVPEIESTTSSSSVHTTPSTTSAKPTETVTAPANDIQKNRSRSISYNAPPNRGKTRSSNSPENTTSHNSFNKRTPVDTVALNINSISRDDEINQVTRNISFSKPYVVEAPANNKPIINGSSNTDKIENRGTILQINEILQVPTVTSTTVKPNTNRQTNHGTLLIREILPSSTEDIPRWSTSNVVAEHTTEKVLLNASKPVVSNEILGVPELEIATLKKDSLASLFTEPVQSVTSSSTTVQYTGSYAKYTTNKDSQRHSTETTARTRTYSTTPRSVRSSTTKPSTTEESTISSTPDTTTQKCLDGTMSKILCLVNATHLRVLKTPTITPDTYITSASNEVTKIATSTVRTTSVEPVTFSRFETSPLKPLALVAEDTPLSLSSEINNALKKSARSNEAVITVTPSATMSTASLLALHFPELDDTNEAANSDSTTTSRSTYIYRIPPNKQGQNGRGRNRARGAKYNSATTETPASSTTTTTTASPTTVAPTRRSTTTATTTTTTEEVSLLSLNSAAELAAQIKETQNQRLTNNNKVVRTPSYRTPAPTTTTTTQKSTSALRLEDLQPATNVDTPSLNVDGLTQQDLLILELLSKRRPVLNEPATTAAPDDGGLLLSSLLAETQKAKSFHRAVPATTTKRPSTTTQAYVVHAQAEETGGGGSNLFSILRQISGGSSGFQQAPAAAQPVKEEDVYIEPSTAAPAIPSRTSKRQRNNLRGSRTTTVPPPEDVYLIDEQEAANNQQSNLVSVAINVTKSVAGFMGRFLQGAARTVTAVVSTSGRALADYLQTWQNPPAVAPQY